MEYKLRVELSVRKVSFYFCFLLPNRLKNVFANPANTLESSFKRSIILQ